MEPFDLKHPDPMFTPSYAQRKKMKACIKKCKKDGKGSECVKHCFHHVFSDETLSQNPPDPMSKTLGTDEMEPFDQKHPDPMFTPSYARRKKLKACFKKCKKKKKGRKCAVACFHHVFSDETLSQNPPDPLSEHLGTDEMEPFDLKHPDPMFTPSYAQRKKMKACIKKCKKDGKGSECVKHCFHHVFSDETLSQNPPDPMSKTLGTDEMEPFDQKHPDPMFTPSYARRKKMKACIKTCKKKKKGRKCVRGCFHRVFSKKAD